MAHTSRIARSNGADTTNTSSSRLPSMPTSTSPERKLLASELKPRKRQHLGQALVCLWRFEVLTALFSVACIGGMVGLLSAVDGKQYGKWRLANVHLTPNALLAILSTLAKSSSLLIVGEALGQLKWAYFQQRAHPLLELQTFDRASRGPLGALRFLWTMRLRAILASLGAIMTVLTLAMDPLTQQLLSFENESIVLDGMSSRIGAAHVLLGTGPTYPRLPNEVKMDFVTNMSSAILSGLMITETPTTFTCPTGDCGWRSFDTLGICSSCEDVSSQLEPSCNAVYPGLKNCTYHFPQRNGMEQSVMTVRYWNASDGTHDIIHRDPQKNISVDFFQEDWSRIAQLTSLSLPTSEWTYSDSSWHNLPEVDIDAVGVICSINFCQQTHAATKVEHGALHDPATALMDLTYNQTWCDNEFNAYWWPCPMWPADHAPPALSMLNASRPEQTPGVYWVHISGAVTPIANALKANLHTTIYELQGSPELSIDHGAVQTQLTDRDLPEILDNIALGLSRMIREQDFDSAAIGHVRMTVTFTRVNWAWLIYLASLTVFASAFLVFSVLYSEEFPGGEAWKSSILPLLAQHVDLHGAERVEQMEERAGGIIVRMREEEGQTRLRPP